MDENIIFEQEENIIEEIPQEPYKIYARTNTSGVVIKIFGGHFEQAQSGDTLIEETYDRHGANKYQVIDENGIYNYQIIYGKLYNRDKSSDLALYRQSQYPYVVESYIRQRYSLSEELAIQRQRDTKYSEFAEYNAYCELCKKNAKKDLGII